MKTKLCTIILCCALAGLEATHAVEYSFPSHGKAEELPEVVVVNVRDIDAGTICDIMEGRCPNIALEISRGETLPLRMFLDGDFAQLAGTTPELAILIKRDLYFRHADGDFLFSVDGSSWHSFTNFFTGKVMVALGIEEVGNPLVTIGAELYEKDHKKY